MNSNQNKRKKKAEGEKETGLVQFNSTTESGRALGFPVPTLSPEHPVLTTNGFFLSLGQDGVTTFYSVLPPFPATIIKLKTFRYASSYHPSTNRDRKSQGRRPPVRGPGWPAGPIQTQARAGFWVQPVPLAVPGDSQSCRKQARTALSRTAYTGC